MAKSILIGILLLSFNCSFGHISSDLANVLIVDTGPIIERQLDDALSFCPTSQDSCGEEAIEDILLKDLVPITDKNSSFSFCYFDSIVPLVQVCDPKTNTFSQEIQVYYRASKSLNILKARIVEFNIDEEFELTGSPLTIRFDSLFAVGVDLNLILRLANSDFEHDCENNQLISSLMAHEPCFIEPVLNDACLNAIELNVNSVCQFQYFSIIGATATEGLNSVCDNFEVRSLPDVWFKYIHPFSDLAGLDVEFVSYFPIMEVYGGNCDSLIYLGCSPEESDLVPGETYYLRSSVGGFRLRQGVFGICLTSYCPDEESISADLNGTFRFQDHISISADNTIESGSEVIYDAGSFIEMTDGFVVDSGAVLNAIIDGCQDESFECPMFETEFIGSYRLSYIGDASAGYGIPFDTTEIVELEYINRFNNTRIVSLQQLPQFGGFLNVVQLGFDCNNVIMFESSIGAACGGGNFKISVIGAHIDGFNIDSPVNRNDDSELIVNFIDYYDDGGCGFDPVVKTMKFTKVE